MTAPLGPPVRAGIRQIAINSLYAGAPAPWGQRAPAGGLTELNEANPSPGIFDTPQAVAVYPEEKVELNGWSSAQMLQRYGRSARGARAR
jgi:hypothetical protein